MWDASYVTWKYRQYKIYHVIFARKYKILQYVNIMEARFISSGTLLFVRIFDIVEPDFIGPCYNLNNNKSDRNINIIDTYSSTLCYCMVSDVGITMTEFIPDKPRK